MAATSWEPATLTTVHQETATAKTFRFQLGHPAAHVPGQHYVLRLTAPDGYVAARSYSVASPPDGSAHIDLTIERLAGGEVSTFMHDEAMVGDELEVRGPIGRWFVWEADRPALLVGGGSGLVPLMAMLRYARQVGATALVHLAVSVRRPDDLYYADELPGPECTVLYTRTAPAGHVRPPGRITGRDLEPLVLPDATAYICGSSAFAEAASQAALAVGVPTSHIRVERFGPSG